MGLLGAVLAGGIGNAAQGASDIIGAQMKFDMQRAENEAKALREENLARLQMQFQEGQTKTKIAADDTRQERADIRADKRQEATILAQKELEAQRSGSEIVGAVGKRLITKGELDKLSAADREAFKSNAELTSALKTEETRAKSAQDFAGLDADGRPVYQGWLENYLKENGGIPPKGFKSAEQLKLEIEKKKADAMATLNSARADAVQNPQEKPLTAAQKSANAAKAASVFSEAQKRAGIDGRIDDNSFELTNALRESADLEPLVPVPAELVPAQKNRFLPDKPAVMGVKYVPLSQAGSSSGLLGADPAGRAPKSGRKPLTAFDKKK